MANMDQGSYFSWIHRFGMWNRHPVLQGMAKDAMMSWQKFFSQ
jgi:hypothetical protein